MSLDDEILRRLADPEDSFTERKEAPQEHPMREAMTAFANSAIPDKPGIIYVGVKDNGEIVGGDNLDSWQRKISSWAASCFPPINVIQTVLSVGDKQILAVVVTASTARPHFAKAAYVRKGAQTEMASRGDIDEWIVFRTSKVRMILDWKDAFVGVVGPVNSSWRGQHKVIACNPFYVTLQEQASSRLWTHPLDAIDIKLNDTYQPAPNQLLLLLHEYYPDHK